MHLSWIQLTGILTLAIMLGAVAVWILMRHVDKHKTKLNNYQQLNVTQDTHHRIYQSLFESIHDGVFIYKDHKLIDCNQHALTIYGRSRAFFENKYPAECSPQFQPNGENSDLLSREILELAFQGNYQRFDWVSSRGNGESFDAAITIIPFESEQTNLITVIVRDITEKKNLERELFHIKSNLEQLVNNQTQNLSKVNETLNERNKELADANSQLYEIAASMKVEVEHRKELQQLLEESQEILKSFIEQAPLGIFIVDDALNITSWNPALATMTGIAESDAIGKPAFEIEARVIGKVDKSAKIKAKMAEFINIDEFSTSITQEGEYIRADKNRGFLRSTFFPIYTSSKKYFGRISQDITYEKMLESKQLNYSQQVDELLIKQAVTNIDLFQKLTTIFNNTNTSIAFFTIENGEISLARCNTTWAEALDKNSNDIQGKRISEFYDSKAVVFITKLINTALYSREKINEEVLWEHNGIYYYLDFTTIPIDYDINSEVKQVACFYRDITEKRLMEQALQEREAHLARAQELAHIGSWKWDLSTKEMQLSKEMERIYEFDTTKPLKLPEAILDAIHPDDYDRILEHVTYNREHINSTSIEHRIKLNDGRVKYLLVINNTIGDSNGTPTIIEGTTQDITQQKEYEQSIIESEAKFREIFDNSLDTISLIDCETNKYYDVNKQFIQITGLKKEDVIGKNREEINVWADYSEREKYTQMLAQDGRVLNFHMHWNVLGGPRNFLLSTETISISNRPYFLTISVDIDEQQRLAQALVESEVKFRNIFNAASVGLLLITNDFKFIDCNPALLSLVGYTREEISQLPSEHFIQESIYPQLYDRIELIRKEKTTKTMNINVLHKNRALIPVEISSDFVKLGDKEMIAVQLRDLSEQKKMEELLITSTIEAEENERRTLAQDLHDDVGPLLSSMNMYLSLLARKPELKPHEAVVKDIEKILKETMATVREISNKISPHILINYGLIAALNNFFKNNERLVPVTLSSNLNEERLPNLTELMLFRIIKEAYNNTVKHAEATLVEVSLFLSEGNLTVEYRDNGKGFDMAIKSTNNVGGLGLHTIQSRLATIGGHFSIKSAPGDGFYMYITLSIP